MPVRIMEFLKVVRIVAIEHVRRPIHSNGRVEGPSEGTPEDPIVPVQRETESGRSPLVSIPPFGRGFSRHRVYRSDRFF